MEATIYSSKRRLLYIPSGTAVVQCIAVYYIQQFIGPVSTKRKKRKQKRIPNANDQAVAPGANSQFNAFGFVVNKNTGVRL